MQPISEPCRIGSAPARIRSLKDWHHMSQLASRPIGRPSPLNLLHRACQRIDDLFLVNVAELGVTPRQYAVMRILAAQKDVSQTDISEATGIDRSTLADIVRRLVGKKLVERKRTKTDARMYAVRLTDSGRRMVTSATAAARNADSGLLSVLNNAEREQFLDMLDRVVEGKSQTGAAKKVRAVTAVSSRKRAA
jgi:DNA-binding MarR family transcriptional regulator